jgi:hypothetical protein
VQILEQLELAVTKSVKQVDFEDAVFNRARGLIPTIVWFWNI